MKYQKKVSVGQFLKKGIDFKENDILEIANEGKQIEGQFGIQDIFLVKLKDGREGNVNFNQTTINGLVDAYGENSISWVGKKVKVWKIKMSVAGKFQDVWFFAHPDAEMSDSGFVLPGKKGATDEIPVINEDEDIDVKDIPF